ncbi:MULTISPECIES: MarR family transcriptional regulator [Clostridium]|jgi:DNA-binding MarR family transcriptional regulator|uniref:MarR family transcriptional regulator n=2 Tax=root TaxID=1 RepID=R9CDI5_9CLOT|nr:MULTISPECIES: MarR family transcriptional regulator [Clostridium]EOR27095.1 MarR family transcriptional regulator [Clostridium sartagoforme AAU1]KLE15377.1 MarR family transcriptional regulator [Clostridium sp. C8]
MSEVKHIGRKINILSHKIKRRIGKVSLEYGISSMQAKILGFISHQAPKRDIFQKTIEEEFDIRRSSVTSVLSLMEKNGLIKRISVCEDARLKKIILTDKGIEVHKSVHKEIEIVESIIFNSLKEEELELFNEILEKLTKNIAE